RCHSRGGDEEPEVVPRPPSKHGSNGTPGKHKRRQTGRDDQETDDDETSDAPPHTRSECQQLTAPVHKYLLYHTARLMEISDRGKNSSPRLTIAYRNHSASNRMQHQSRCSSSRKCSPPTMWVRVLLMSSASSCTRVSKLPNACAFAL